MPMLMSKPPSIENRLYCSPSYSQSFIVSIYIGLAIAADVLSLSACFLVSGPSASLGRRQSPANSCHSGESRYVGPRNPVQVIQQVRTGD